MRKFNRVAAGAILISAAMLTGTAHGQAAMADGQITKIDASAGKITLRHGPIKHLDMDAMTMVFRVQDAAVFKTFKVGDKVKFEVDRVNGQLTVTKVQKAK